MMKLPVFFTLVLMLSGALTARAQSGSFLFRIHGMQPTADLFNSDVSKNSFSINLGYGLGTNDGHFGTDLTAFIDVMRYSFYFDEDKHFEGWTLYSGLALTPNYCFNPQSKVQVSLGVSLKAGYNAGYGTVYKYRLFQANEDNRLESKTAGGDLALAISPMITLAYPLDIGKLGLELGYDSSNYGAGINRLRSNYYPPINYHSGYVFIGAFFRLNAH